MTDRRQMSAPANAAEAADQLDHLGVGLESARTFARQYGTAADRAEHLYRRERAKAAVQVEGRNAEAREGAIHQWPLDGEVKAEALEVCQAAGLGDYAPGTVGELRWVRDRCSRLADEWSATAYDRRARMQAWMTVASMARSEAELGPPAEPLRVAGGRP